MKRYLKEWEERNPRIEPTLRRDNLSEAERKQLESIGYLDDDS